jgi:hypothetical protein
MKHKFNLFIIYFCDFFLRCGQYLRLLNAKIIAEILILKKCKQAAMTYSNYYTSSFKEIIFLFNSHSEGELESRLGPLGTSAIVPAPGENLVE